ncbi:hypothetical protein LTT66_02530 [Nocardia gipuzkoensis]|nr:hypothetical protein [Nocardia gipuzkoensis]UGT69111.1 hypothetical protein LTT66_02530 [Nocardia gipuzkoensis]
MTHPLDTRARSDAEFVLRPHLTPRGHLDPHHPHRRTTAHEGAKAS